MCAVCVLLCPVLYNSVRLVNRITFYPLSPLTSRSRYFYKATQVMSGPAPPRCVLDCFDSRCESQKYHTICETTVSSHVTGECALWPSATVNRSTAWVLLYKLWINLTKIDEMISLATLEFKSHLSNSQPDTPASLPHPCPQTALLCCVHVLYYSSKWCSNISVVVRHCVTIIVTGMNVRSNLESSPLKAYYFFHYYTAYSYFESNREVA